MTEPNGASHHSLKTWAKPISKKYGGADCHALEACLWLMAQGSIHRHSSDASRRLANQRCCAWSNGIEQPTTVRCWWVDRCGGPKGAKLLRDPSAYCGDDLFSTLTCWASRTRGGQTSPCAGKSPCCHHPDQTTCRRPDRNGSGDLARQHAMRQKLVWRAKANGWGSPARTGPQPQGAAVRRALAALDPKRHKRSCSLLQRHQPRTGADHPADPHEIGFGP